MLFALGVGTLLDVRVVDVDWGGSEVDGFFSDVDLLIVAGLKAFEEDLGVVAIDLGVGISLAAETLEDCLVDCTVMVVVRVLLFMMTLFVEAIELSWFDEAVLDVRPKAAIGTIDIRVDEADVVELVVTVMVELRVLLFIRTGSGEVVEFSGVAKEVARMTLLEPAIGITDTLMAEADVIELAVTVTLGGKAATVVLADKENCVAVPTGGTPVQGITLITPAPRKSVDMEWVLMLTASQLLAPTTTSPELKSVLVYVN